MENDYMKLQNFNINNFGSYMRTGVVEDAYGYYNHEEEVKGLHVRMGNSKTKSNGRRGGKEPVTMGIMCRKVKISWADNERIIKDREEIL
jgi:hypothetical protein